MAERVLVKVSAIQSIQDLVLNEILTAEGYLTPDQVYKNLRSGSKYSLDRVVFRKALTQLISAGRLQYIYQYGCSLLTTSHNGPLQISRHFVVKSPRIHFVGDGHIKVIAIEPGAAFGRGDHPSTALAFHLMDSLVDNIGMERIQIRALDIGTGSGILAIALAQWGVEHVVAIDVDECARFEAKENARLNKLENKIQISAESVECVQGLFGIVVANLRFPTLCGLVPQMLRIVPGGGKIIFSGLKTEELPHLLSEYTQTEFLCEETASRRGWSAVLLTRI